MSASVVEFQTRWCTTNVTIDSGSVTSSGGALQGTRLIGLVTPTGLQGTTLSVQASVDGTTYLNLYGKAGAQLQVSCATSSRHIYLTPDDEVRVGYIRMVAAATQTASRILTLVSLAS